MEKSIIDRDTVIDATNNAYGKTGVLILKQDDEGGHLITLAEGNILPPGERLVSNTFPRAITAIYYERDDEYAYIRSRILKEGIPPTVLPQFSIDDYFKTLEIFASYPDDQILLSTNGGPWETYTGPFAIADIDRPAGYWRAKIKAAENRIESKIQYSLPTVQGKRGLPLPLPITLN